MGPENANRSYCGVIRQRKRNVRQRYSWDAWDNEERIHPHTRDYPRGFRSASLFRLSLRLTPTDQVGPARDRYAVCTSLMTASIALMPSIVRGWTSQRTSSKPSC